MKLILHTDGGSRGNPGQAAYGFVILDEAGSVILDGGKYLGIATNNEAEYQGLIGGLEAVLAFQNQYQIEQLTIKMDSKLVVEQVLGNWKVKEERLRPYVLEARRLLHTFQYPYRLLAVPRAENSLADAKVNNTLDSLK